MKNMFMLSWFARLTGEHLNDRALTICRFRGPLAAAVSRLHGLAGLARADARRFDWSVTCPVGAIACPCNKAGAHPAAVFSAWTGPGVW